MSFEEEWIDLEIILLSKVSHREKDKYHIIPPMVVQMIKDLPAMWETQVWSLVREDPLEKGMATHFSILA